MNRRKMIFKGLQAGTFVVVAPVFTVGLNHTFESISKEKVMRRIPSSGEQVPAIGMGTWQTFDVGQNAEKRANLKEVLNLFVENGGKIVDSSPMYGSSEEVVGDLAQQLGLHKELFMATKVWTSGEQSGIRQMEESMKLLKVEKIDLMQVHNLLDYSTHLKTLRKWKEEGRVRYIGITHYTTSAYPNLMKVIKEHPVDFVQFNYSIQTREAEQSILPFAADNGVAVVINRPFEGGGLFSAVKGKELPSWAKEFDASSWGNFFLKYIISNPAVTCAIPATSNPKHLLDNMNALYGRLPDSNMRQQMVKFMQSL